MPKIYPAEYRRWLCERMLAGEPAVRLSEEAGVTITWHRNQGHFTSLTVNQDHQELDIVWLASPPLA